MRKTIGVLLLLMVSTLANAGTMESEFQRVKRIYEERVKTAQQDLKQYLQDYPYTTYYSDVQLMLGVLQTEKGKHKQALKTLDKVVWKDLRREDQPMYYFYKGYNLIQLNDLTAATACFRTLRDSQNPYTVQAKYYYAYCLYRQGEYEKALPSFLEIENSAQYRQIVPYYVIQIYYAQHQDEEVYQRAEELLKRNPTNENNGEVHRILGELYFAKEDWQNASEHLTQYADDCIAKNKKPLRENQYELGAALYHQQQYAEALNNLKAVKQEKDALSESTCLYMGHTYVRLEQIEKAKLSYAAAMNFGITDKVREEAMYNYALTTYQSNSALGESATAFKDFLREYPNTEHATQVYQLLATVYMSCKNYRAALEAVDAIPQQTAKVEQIRSYLRYQIGVDAFLQGKMVECEQWMTEVIDHEKAGSTYKTDAYYYRAEARYRLRQYEACYNDLKLCLAQEKATANRTMVDYLMGYSQFSLKQYSEAEVAFRRFVAQQGVAPSAYADAKNRIGDCCFNNRAFAAAIEAYKEVADNNGAGADYALFQMGYAHGLLRHYNEKAEIMEQLVASYPKSDYADDALYEIARARLQDEQNEDAINAYTRLIDQYPNSNLARKAALEKGLIYRNIRQNDNAISAFQYTIAQYPGSEESFKALDALEQIYVETNRVTEYLAYTKTIGKMNTKTSSQEDSLVYVTAELQYMMGNYKDAAAGLTTYLNRFCAGGRYCTLAAWYCADSYYHLNDRSAAIDMYTILQDIPGNPYAEETCTRMAELLYEQKDYAAAREQFRQMQQLASKPQAKTNAMLGCLRCSFFLQDDSAVIETATTLLSMEPSSEVRDEALYNRAKAYYRQQQYGPAAVDFAPLSKNVRVVTGAESSYLLADCYVHLSALESAESEIMRFAGSKSQHQYWLARSMVLLSDINMQRGDMFQAKQYLLSLRNNYHQEDDIQSLIRERLQAIEQQEEALDQQEAQAMEDENEDTQSSTVVNKEKEEEE